MKNKQHIRIAALAAISMASAVLPTASAAIVNGNEGINMGQVNEGLIYNMLTIPVNSAFGETWTTAHSGFAQFVAPVSQFTGVNDDGSLVPVGDLIPLKTTKVNVVNSAGANYFTIDGTTGTITGPGASSIGNPYPRQFVQFNAPGIQYPVYIAGDPVASRIYFGGGVTAFSPNSGTVVPSYTTGTVTLKAGRSYKLTFNPFRFGTWYTETTYPVLFYQFRNVTTGQLFGPQGVCEQLQNPNGTNAGLLNAFIATTQDTVVALEVQGSYNGPTLHSCVLIVETAD